MQQSAGTESDDSERIPPGRPLTSPSLTHSGDLVGDTGKLEDHEQNDTAGGSIISQQVHDAVARHCALCMPPTPASERRWSRKMSKVTALVKPGTLLKSARQSPSTFPADEHSSS